MVRCINNTHRLAFKLQTEGETRQTERTHSVVKLRPRASKCMQPDCGHERNRALYIRIYSTNHTLYWVPMPNITGWGGGGKTEHGY